MQKMDPPLTMTILQSTKLSGDGQELSEKIGDLLKRIPCISGSDLLFASCLYNNGVHQYKNLSNRWGLAL
jgi:hypothetical protein